MTATPRILVVDDDPMIATMCRQALEEAGFAVDTVYNGEEALARLREHTYDVVLTDVRMPRMDGLTLLHEIQTHYPDVVVVLMTAYADIETAVQAMEAGAFDYIPKPFSVQHLRVSLQRAVEHRQLRSRATAPEQTVDAIIEQTRAFDAIVTQSETMRAVIRQAMKAARSDVPVLILGESGTGKELLAKAIHQASHRADGPFVTVDCASIPETLLESELFGYEPGAFTGAQKRKHGLIELADGGTLFLDEIGELPAPLQAKLLRVLQDGRIRRLGGRTEITVNFRLISATNRDLHAMVEQHQFREDLWFRINVITLEIPPLRERKEDILLLAHYFLQELNRRGPRQVEGLSSAVQWILQKYDWPGNVRELRNVIEHAHAMAEGAWITPMDLPEFILRAVQPAEVSWDAAIVWPEELLRRPFYEARRALLEQFERTYFTHLIERAGGRIMDAARMAGLHRGVLHRFLKKYAIRVRDRKQVTKKK